MLSSNIIQELVSYKEMSVNKETMYDFYRNNNASDEVLSLVKLENKRFGTVMENMLTEYLGMTRPNKNITSYDRTFVMNSGKDVCIEIKSSRIWRKGKVQQFKWQHIMKDHEYDMLLLAGLDFNNIRLYAISKKKVMELYDKGVIKKQGRAEGQGLWFSLSQVKHYITDVGTRDKLLTFCTNLS